MGRAEFALLAAERRAQRSATRAARRTQVLDPKVLDAEIVSAEILCILEMMIVLRPVPCFHRHGVAHAFVPPSYTMAVVHERSPKPEQRCRQRCVFVPPGTLLWNHCSRLVVRVRSFGITCETLRLIRTAPSLDVPLQRKSETEHLSAATFLHRFGAHRRKVGHSMTNTSHISGRRAILVVLKVIISRF